MRYLRGMSEIFARACLVCLGVCFWGCAGAARTEVVAHVQGGQYAAAVARYEREGKPCYDCGHVVMMRRQGEQQRSTYYCLSCQPSRSTT